jgi:tRNA(adenine34) deaminase
MMTNPDCLFMEEALRLASLGFENDEVPVGAVVVLDGRIVGRGWNQRLGTHDPTAHAEVVALRMATGSLKNYRLPKATLYVTLEPCFMCFGSMIESRVERLVFAAREPRSGVTGSLYDLHNDPRIHHRIIVESGVMEKESRALLQTFFKNRRGEEKAGF